MALNSNYDVIAEQAEALEQKQHLLVAVTGLGLATVGALVVPIFYLPSIACTLYISRLYIQEACQRLITERRLDYRTVWALGMPATLATGFFFAAALAAVSGRIGSYLITKTESRSKQSIVDLFDGQIRTVWRMVDDLEVKTPIEQVQVGDTVVVQAGQMIPVDGMITAGTTTVDQHMLTGEAQPAEKGIGDTVLASTMLLAGRVYVQVEKTGTATVASQITQSLNQTNDFKQTLQSRTEVWLNRMILPTMSLSVLALLVSGISSAVAMLWYNPGSRLIVFAPLTMLGYLQIAAQKGILIKDGRALETLHGVDTVIFDKTGTLTLEQPTVSQILVIDNLTESPLTEVDVLRFAAAAEAKQSHPIARAILQAAVEQGIDLPPLEDVQYKVGYGLTTRIQGYTVHVGSLRFMEQEEIDILPELIAQQEESQAQGHSLVLVALNHIIVGAIELQPTIRPEARACINDLQHRRLETVIISGDNETMTRQLAVDLDVDRYFAEVLPEDKAQFVEQLQGEGRRVCFVGDGINDSIALKVADVSVSLRGATTIATDVAQIVFMDGTLGQLTSLFIQSDKFADNMRLNTLFSVIPHMIGIAGTFLFGWGLMASVLILDGSMPISMYYALKPLLSEQRSQKN